MKTRTDHNWNGKTDAEANFKMSAIELMRALGLILGSRNRRGRCKTCESNLASE